MANILLTGATGGIGTTLYEKLSEQGHQVYGVGEYGPDYAIDFNYPENLEASMEEIFDRASEFYGGRSLKTPVEILINNAGTTDIDMLEHSELENFIRVQNVNVVAPYLFARKFVQQLIEHKTSEKNLWSSQVQKLDIEFEYKYKYRIVNTCSMSTKMGLRGCSAYPGSKAFLELMTRGWSKEFASKYPITVIGVSPGNVEDTGMVDYAIDSLQRTRDMTLEEAQIYNMQSPLKRYMTKDEVWAMFDFAVNNAPEYMTGSVIYAPNGMGI